MITGFFPPDRPPHPYLSVAVFVPGVSTEWALVDFLIDTGAARTSIHPLDAIRRLGISPAMLADRSQWQNTIASGGVGGPATYFDLPAFYGFQTDADVAWDIIEGRLMLAELTAHNQRIPSLMGWDLLSLFELVIHGGNGRVTLKQQ